MEYLTALPVSALNSHLVLKMKKAVFSETPANQTTTTQCHHPENKISCKTCEMLTNISHLMFSKNKTY
jgi:hypothetical protein